MAAECHVGLWTLTIVLLKLYRNYWVARRLFPCKWHAYFLKNDSSSEDLLRNCLHWPLHCFCISVFISLLTLSPLAHWLRVFQESSHSVSTLIRNLLGLFQEASSSEPMSLAFEGQSYRSRGGAVNHWSDQRATEELQLMQTLAHINMCVSVSQAVKHPDEIRGEQGHVSCPRWWLSFLKSYKCSPSVNEKTCCVSHQSQLHLDHQYATVGIQEILFWRKNSTYLYSVTRALKCLSEHPVVMKTSSSFSSEPQRSQSFTNVLF